MTDEQKEILDKNVQWYEEQYVGLWHAHHHAFLLIHDCKLKKVIKCFHRSDSGWYDRLIRCKGKNHPLYTTYYITRRQRLYNKMLKYAVKTLKLELGTFIIQETQTQDKAFREEFIYSPISAAPDKEKGIFYE